MLVTSFYLTILVIGLLRSKTVKAIEKSIKREDEIIEKEDLPSKDINFLLRKLFNFIMLCAGLMTSQFIIFLILLVLDLIPTRNKYIRLGINYITIVSSLFIVLNRYHLGINITALIFG